MFLRRSNKIKGEISIDEPLNQDGDGNELLLSDILGTDSDVTSRQIEDEVDKSLLRASIAKLNNRERNIMRTLPLDLLVKKRSCKIHEHAGKS